MRTFTTFTALTTMIGAVMSAPSEFKRQDIPEAYPVDFQNACKEFQPGPGACQLVAAGGITLEWDGNNLGNGNSDKMAVLLNSNCDIYAATTWDPQSPGFSVTMLMREDNGDTTNLYSLYAETSWIGMDSIPMETIQLDGNTPDFSCTGEKSGMSGLNAGYWNSCNFNGCPVA